MIREGARRHPCQADAVGQRHRDLDKVDPVRGATTEIALEALYRFAAQHYLLRQERASHSEPPPAPLSNAPATALRWRRLRHGDAAQMGGTLGFWYEFASTYSYPAAARIEAAVAPGTTIEWRPFLLGPILARQGWTDSPFNLYPAKGRYMWRDLERICAALGLPLRRPTAFPRNGLLAARVALIAADEGWCGPFTRAVYRANFAEDQDIAAPAVIAGILETLGRPAPALLARAAEPEIKDRLKAQTEAAAAHGIFGAPSFTVGGELFWGNDRLEEALAWAERGEPR
jgi:2-hydroxychromene-2-carboxylate isomerase